MYNKKASSCLDFPHSPSAADAGLLLLRLREQPANAPNASSLFFDSASNLSFEDTDNSQNETLHIETRTYFQSRERDTSTRPEYMDKQPNITKKDRTRVVNNLIDIELEYLIINDDDDDDDDDEYDKYDTENIVSDDENMDVAHTCQTIHFAINFMDRYLAKVLIQSVAELIIIGSTCLLLASKSMDCQNTSLTIDIMVKESKRIYNGQFSFSKEDIIKMETQILKELNYSLYVPTSYSFIDVYWNLKLVDDDTLTLTSRILLLCLLSYDMLKYLPSETATAALWLARKIIGNLPTWTNTMIDKTTYSEDEILPIALDISMMYSRALLSVDDVYVKFRRTRYTLFSDPKLPSVMQNEDNNNDDVDVEMSEN